MKKVTTKVLDLKELEKKLAEELKSAEVIYDCSMNWICYSNAA